MPPPNQPLSIFHATNPLEPRHPEPFDAALRDLGTLNPGWPIRTPAPELSEFSTSPHWRKSLALTERFIEFGRLKVREGDCVYQCGQEFETLYLVNSGFFKIVNLAPDGREHAAGLFFKGDWLGFDGIPNGIYTCSSIALDIGEVWTIPYNALLEASAHEPMLMRLMIAAVSEQLTRNRNAALAIGTLPANARVADFLLQWLFALAERGLRTDQINFHMSRAEIGNYLGLTLGTVSRAFSKLAQSGAIQFHEKKRRVICIPKLEALREFIENNTDDGS
jgi:CRP/FNR family transcriptional regulator